MHLSIFDKVITIYIKLSWKIPEIYKFATNAIHIIFFLLLQCFQIENENNKNDEMGKIKNKTI